VGEVAVFKKRNEPAHLERPAIQSIDDGLAWLQTQKKWPIETDKERLQIVKRLIGMRRTYAAEWRNRGGDEDD
jgi:hypothetical protein